MWLRHSAGCYTGIVNVPNAGIVHCCTVLMEFHVAPPWSMEHGGPLQLH